MEEYKTREVFGQILPSWGGRIWPKNIKITIKLIIMRKIRHPPVLSTKSGIRLSYSKK
jgi:hypothetical protein